MITKFNRMARLGANAVLFLWLALCLGLPVTVRPALAGTAPEQICDQVAQIASNNTGVPITVLQAITRTETGRKKDGHFTPWPWTVNMEGKGVWFDTPDAARAYVFKHFKRGARSFDVGCFQINYKWHHKAFSSIEEMFDPLANATYAARFLKDLYAELGNWPDAAGAYHSRTPKYADKYKAIFNKHHRNAPGATMAVAAPRDARSPIPKRSPRVNNFPLLQDGGGRRLGSLVPIGNRSAQGGFLDLGEIRPNRLIGG